MKKQRSLALLLFVLVIYSSVMAEEMQSMLWTETQMFGGHHPARGLAYYEKGLIGPLSFYAVADKESDGYYEGYAGFKYGIVKDVSIGAAIGREKGFHNPRTNVFLDAKLLEGKLAIFASLEKGGGSGNWIKTTATYAFSEKFGCGVMKETLAGLGPRCEYNFASSWQIWLAFLHDREENRNRGVLGVNRTW